LAAGAPSAGGAPAGAEGWAWAWNEISAASDATATIVKMDFMLGWLADRKIASAGPRGACGGAEVCGLRGEEDFGGLIPHRPSSLQTRFPPPRHAIRPVYRLCRGSENVPAHHTIRLTPGSAVSSTKFAFLAAVGSRLSTPMGSKCRRRAVRSRIATRGRARPATLFTATRLNTVAHVADSPGRGWPT
jgi:hypothetical protein